MICVICIFWDVFISYAHTRNRATILYDSDKLRQRRQQRKLRRQRPHGGGCSVSATLSVYHLRQLQTCGSWTHDAIAGIVQHACRRFREGGHVRWRAYSLIRVHGCDSILRANGSMIPWFAGSMDPRFDHSDQFCIAVSIQLFGNSMVRSMVCGSWFDTWMSGEWWVISDFDSFTAGWVGDSEHFYASIFRCFGEPMTWRRSQQKSRYVQDYTLYVGAPAI